MSGPLDPPTRLARQLGTADAVLVGLGAMIGAGVFAAFAPAARAAGNGLLLGLALAAWIAYCNATSSAQLAALYPESGGTYVYAGRRLGSLWGFLAGWGFVIGKLASCAAMALTFGSYVSPALARPLALGAVLALSLINYLGVRKTLAATRVLLAGVLSALALVVGAIWLGGEASFARLWPLHASAYGVLRSAGFLFFAFAGYARLATLGEEVREPQRTIPRAIPRALGGALLVYALVAISALCGAGAEALAGSSAPLALAVERGRLGWLSPLVRAGAALGSLGVLLSLLVGVSRTLFAMAANGDLPVWFAAVDARRAVPQRAELSVGALVIGIVALADVRGAIGFSSCAVLVYYALTNAAAWTLTPLERRWPRALAGLGLGGCLVLAASLPAISVAAGGGLLGLGVLAYALRGRGGRADPR